jgi:hypothetical protein
VKPSILVSYAHLKPHHVPLKGDGFDQWVLDSGAYTAHNSGKTIIPEEFIKFATEAKTSDPRLDTIFALDVIGDPETSLKNALAAKKAGVAVVPCWHAGEPIEFAQEMAKQFPRIALGGLVARLQNNRSQLMDSRTKMHYAEKFFCAVWPKWIHGFGCTGEALMSALPFAAVDSTTWALRPSMYGSWKTFGALPVRVSKNIRPALEAEARWFLDRESFHDAQWRKELQKVACDRFRIRLACSLANIKELNSMFGTGNPKAAVSSKEAAAVEVTKELPHSDTLAPAAPTAFNAKESKPQKTTAVLEDKWANWGRVVKT